MSWVFLALGACRGDKEPTVQETGAPIIWDTGAVVDTVAEDTDTGAVDTGDAGDWRALVAAPDGLVVHPGAIWSLRASAQALDGTWTDVDAAWTSDAPEVVSVDAGVASASAAGEATLTASFGALSASATVVVRDDGTMLVIVRDADTGELVTNATAVIDDGDRVSDDDADGSLALPVSDGLPAVLTVYARGYVAATLWGTVARELVVPLRPNTSLETSAGRVSGAVDLSEVPAGDPDEIRVGVAAPSLRGPALLLDPDALLAEDRPLTLYGVETSLPENVYLVDYAEDYTVPVEAGPAAVWTLAGPLPIGDLLAGLTGAGDVLALMQEHRDTLAWGWSAAGEVAADEEATADLLPSIPLTGGLLVDVGTAPGGFEDDEDALVLVGYELEEEGLLVTGFGLGDGVVDVARASATVTGAVLERALALRQVGGFGSGGAVCASTGVVDGDAIALPALPDAPALSFAGETRAFTLTTDLDADFVRASIESADGAVRDLYLSGADTSGVLPLAGIPFGYGRTSWSVTALHTASGTFDGYVAAGRLDPEELAAEASAAARLTERY